MTFYFVRVARIWDPNDSWDISTYTNRMGYEDLNDAYKASQLADEQEDSQGRMLYTVMRGNEPLPPVPARELQQ